MGLVVGAVRKRFRARREDLNGQRNRKIGADDRSLAGLQVGQERRSGPINFAAGAFDNLAVPIIREPMYHECSHLAQNTFRYVAWALS